MNVMDVGKVLRWLGYAVSFDVQQRLVKEVDVDQSGSLDIAEMRKLARIFREKELLSWSDTFKKRDKAKIGVMSVDACTHSPGHWHSGNSRGSERDPFHATAHFCGSEDQCLESEFK
jgi:hypothetical protein